MINHDLAEILNRNLGLHLPSIGTKTLERSIIRRLKSLNLGSQQEYVALLGKNPAELRNLIDEVVISETWFFRDTEPFLALKEQFAALVAQSPGKRIRILSIPCASGEEPYSIVMTLLEAGWTREMFSVDAVDISRKAIAKAKRAVFTKNSFRSADLKFRGKFFKMKGNAFELNEEISRKVRFFCGNILDPDFMAILGQYEIVFCRNILIYLDFEAQKRTIATLGHLLAPQGLLFVGSAEANIYLSYGFAPFSSHFCFALILSPKKKNLLKRAGDWEGRQTENPVIQRKKEEFSVKEKPCVEPKLTEIPVARQLEEAQFLADKGDLDAAEQICHGLLDTQGPSPEVYYLLGIINKIAGKTEHAVTLLKKALYLNPDHQDSLVLLGLLSEKLGDKKAVANYKRRLLRVDEKQKCN